MGIEFPDHENTAMHLENMGISHPFGDHWLRIDSTGEEPWTPGTMALKPYTELMLTLNRLGWRPCPHVCADRVRKIDADTATNSHLDAFEAADRVSSIKEKRWYMEHTPFATPEQIDRMAKLGVIICVNDHGYYEPLPPPYPQEKERLAHQTPIRSFLDKKIVVISGSDYRGPASDEMHPNNPMIFFSLYVTRKAKDGKPLAAAEKISRQEALYDRHGECRLCNVRGEDQRVDRTGQTGRFRDPFPGPPDGAGRPDPRYQTAGHVRGR